MEIYTSYTSECHVAQDNVRKSYFLSDPKQILSAKAEVVILQILDKFSGFPKVRKFYLDAMNSRFHIEMNYVGEPIQSPSDKGQSRKILREVVNLLQILHEKNIIHADIKPENVLMDDNGNISVIDFSHSYLLTSDSKIIPDKHVYQTLCYTAPESLDITQLKTSKIDIWSLGCLYYELLTDKVLFWVDTEKELNKMFYTKEHLKLINSQPFDAVEKQLLLRMLEIDPNNRANLDEIKRILQMI